MHNYPLFKVIISNKKDSDGRHSEIGCQKCGEPLAERSFFCQGENEVEYFQKLKISDKFWHSGDWTIDKGA
jgi:hypothetical protein